LHSPLKFVRPPPPPPSMPHDPKKKAFVTARRPAAWFMSCWSAFGLIACGRQALEQKAHLWEETDLNRDFLVRSPNYGSLHLVLRMSIFFFATDTEDFQMCVNSLVQFTPLLQSTRISN
jgi:hypothetical protein